MRLLKEDRSTFYRLLLPALAEALIAQLFLIADSVMLGQMPDSTLAVAAVGVCNSPINLVICPMNNFFFGTTAAIAWHWGAGEKEELRSLAWQSLLLALGFGLTLTLIPALFGEEIMRIVCGEGEILSVAARYFRINAVGFLFQILTLAISADFRGVGITRVPMIFNLGSGLLNVGLNYLLIFGKLGCPALGVDGAAIATVISKVVGFVAAIGFLIFSPSPIRWKRGMSRKPVPSLRSRVLPIGLTAAAEQVILQGGATVSVMILSDLPTAEIASVNIVSSMESLIWSAGSACGVASTTLFGRCLGARDEKKARAFLAMNVRFGLAIAVVIGTALCIFGRAAASLFSNDPSLYGMIAALLPISVAALPFINTHQSVAGAMRSAGDSVAPLLASLFSLWVFRVALGYLTVSVLHLGVFAYRICITADQVARCAAVLFFYQRGHWRRFLNQ